MVIAARHIGGFGILGPDEHRSIQLLDRKLGCCYLYTEGVGGHESDTVGHCILAVVCPRAEQHWDLVWVEASLGTLEVAALAQAKMHAEECKSSRLLRSATLTIPVTMM
ncbi:hypothetical protein NDU88_006837 [Pleurodeles waltl]|uniref:Uncharacterized protein n=1 Tax=Pleurodeles waltl TaxID=8319 RepID=A0AAV7UM58_PLEWA|nr:hypothetical protein NDU88_006837 [Pleurodeles waltl]